MTGFDTNVLVSYIMQDDPGYITMVSVMELY